MLSGMITDQVAVQVEAVSMARAPVQVEEDFTVRAILVTKEDIIHNPAEVISSNSPDIRATQNS